MSFKEYYEYYLSLHQNKWTRRFHVCGQLLTIMFIVGALYSKIWALLLLAPFIIYPFAWFAHFFFEKNKPAAWSNPLWAKACDWVMLKDVLIGKLEW